MSFDFAEDGRVCFSIETRSQRGQTYSAIGGLYRQFEQIYVVADERDVIRLRSNFRQGEEVYLYRFNVSPTPRARCSSNTSADAERSARTSALVQRPHQQLHHRDPTATRRG